MGSLGENAKPSEYPLYNIGVVSRMTGIAIPTLRAWERRYGFPESHRTAGGHRLYSEHDVVRLRWVKSQVDQGLQTAQAIQALQHVPEPNRAMPLSAGVSRTSQFHPGEVERNAHLERLVAALLGHDTTAADGVLGDALLDLPLGEVLFQVVVPALNEIGLAWQEDQISVATEHLATNYVRHRLMRWMLGGPPPFPVSPVVLAGAPGELHEGSLLILGTLLRQRRWPVAYLGQSVPLSDLALFVQQINPLAVVLVAMTEEPAHNLIEWPSYLPAQRGGKQPTIAFGGRIFTKQAAWRERVPGLFLGETLEQGIETLDRVLQSPYSQ